ncbi:MAG: GGDEF domain-containing protein [Thermomicrobiales bacterium]
MAVTQTDLTDFNLTHHIAPVVPKFMALTGAFTMSGWFISAVVGNPNLAYLAAIHGLCGLTMILLGLACHRTASAGQVGATTGISVLFVFVAASCLCLAAANNHTGFLQSLPYCMVLTGVSGFFWPNLWGLIVGSIAGMTPPVILVVGGYSTLSSTPRFYVIYAQLWFCALAVSFFLYLFMNQVRRGYIVTLRDLEEQSRRDALTALFNRRSFYDQVAVSRAGRETRDGSPSGLLLYLDIDYFKGINDRFGHAEGDLVLQGVARALETVCEPTDLIARFGGEEFVVYRSGAVSTEEGFVLLTDRLQAALRRINVSYGGVAVTVSVGGTPMYPDEPLDVALQRADAALLRAKRDGRNRAIFAPLAVFSDEAAVAHPVIPGTLPIELIGLRPAATA